MSSTANVLYRRPLLGDVEYSQRSYLQLSLCIKVCSPSPALVKEGLQAKLGRRTLLAAYTCEQMLLLAHISWSGRELDARFFCSVVRLAVSGWCLLHQVAISLLSCVRQLIRGV